MVHSKEIEEFCSCWWQESANGWHVYGTGSLSGKGIGQLQPPYCVSKEILELLPPAYCFDEDT